MYIKFKALTIEGFQSIGNECCIDLESQGFVNIKGINEYDNKASSNGSGKSSLMESLNWCLFGKTSAGVTTVKNRYYNNGCCVSVTFEKNSQEYVISRYLDHHKFKSGITVKKCQKDTFEDLSCRNKSDTDKLIKDTILPFTQDIFLSTIFLSQGFSGRLSLLTPSARKERLEILANIDEAVNQFKDKVSEKKNEYQDQLNKITSEISYLTGQLDVFTKEKDEITELQNQKLLDVPDIPIETLRNKLRTLEPKIVEISEQINSSALAVNKEISAYNTEKRQLQFIKAEWEKICQKLNDIHVTGECPTCHQPITEELSKDVEQEYINTADDYESKMNAYEQNIKDREKIYIEQNALYESLKEKKSALQTLYTRTKTSIEEYDGSLAKNTEIQNKLSRLDTCIDRIAVLSSEIASKAQEQSKVELTYQIADHSLKLITKDFRAYLLSDIISKMNSKLAEYSQKLFENQTDRISLSTEDNKLNILLGDNSYESLSGGEKKKVDLALVLAQRDIALLISGFQCNLLVLDEILENMDAVSSDISLRLLNDVSGDIESLYVISHNNYAIPVDRTITVTKHQNRLSTIDIK